MDKVDLKKSAKEFFSAKEKFALISLPSAQYLMVDGIGDPNTSAEYMQAIELLYATAYTIKFAMKADGGDFVVPPMESLWWSIDMNDFTTGNKDRWQWTAMIMMPSTVTKTIFKSATKSVKEKKNLAVEKIRLEKLSEGLVVQYLHIGPYSEEGPKLSELHNEFMPTNNLTFNGKHHEVYLGDPRKGDPAKLKTIIRQPVKRIQ